MFICPIYYHNWRNISTIYVHNNTSIKRNILTIKKIHRVVGRAKDLPAPSYRPVTLCNIQSNVPVFMCVIRPWIRRKTNLNVFSFLVCAVWKKCFFKWFLSLRIIRGGCAFCVCMYVNNELFHLIHTLSSVQTYEHMSTLVRIAYVLSSSRNLAKRQAGLGVSTAYLTPNVFSAFQKHYLVTSLR